MANAAVEDRALETSAVGLSSGSEKADRAAWLLVGLALIPRVFDLDRLPLWEDEAATWWFGLNVIGGGLGEQLQVEPTPPLHYALTGAMLRFVGDADLFMRLPSALFGALSVFAAYLLGRRVVSARAGLCAASWLAIHPWHVLFSREARVYTLLLLLTLLLWATLWRALERDRARDWLLMSGLLAVACWSHFYGLFLGFTVGVVILALAPSSAVRWRGLAAAALGGLLFAPYLVLAVPHLEQTGADWSVGRLYEAFPEAVKPWWIAEGHAIGARRFPAVRGLVKPQTPAPIWGPAMAVQSGLVLLAAWSWVSRRQAGSAVMPRADGGLEDGRRRALFLALTWIVPLAVPWAISTWHRPIFHPGRHDFYSLGLSAIWIGAGIDLALRWRAGRGSSRRGPRFWARTALAVGMVLVMAGAALFRLGWLHVLPVAEGPRQTGAWLAEQGWDRPEQPGDGTAIVATGIRRLKNERYLRQRLALDGALTPAESLDPRRRFIESFPASTDRHPGWADPRELVPLQAELAAEARDRAVAWAAAEPPVQRIVVLAQAYPSSAEERRYSEAWWVDRHLFVGLAKAGYAPTRVPGAEALGDRVLVFELEGREGSEP